MDKIITENDIIKIGSFLHENDYDLNLIDVVIYITDKAVLNKINEDYYYRNKKDGDVLLEEVDEVSITIGNIKFIYKLKEKDGEIKD